MNFSTKEPSLLQTRPCCCNIARSPDRSVKRSAYVSCMLHYKVITHILTPALAGSVCVGVLCACVWREIMFMWVTWEGRGGGWWWKSGLTGLWLSVVCVSCFKKNVFLHVQCVSSHVSLKHELSNHPLPRQCRQKHGGNLHCCDGCACLVCYKRNWATCLTQFSINYSFENMLFNIVLIPCPLLPCIAIISPNVANH